MVKFQRNRSTLLDSGDLNLQGIVLNGVHMRDEIEKEVKRCAGEIRKISPASRVIVFGSSVDEKVRHPRDIDLLVVIPDSEPFKATRRRILSIPRSTWPLDIIVVPSNFLEQKIRESSNFYAFVCQEGTEIGQDPKISA